MLFRSKRKDAYVKELSELTTQRVAYSSGIKKLEAEVGPIKYISEMIYSESGTDQLERAVRAVTVLLVLVFDPLAVVLLLAANHGLARKRQLTNFREPSILKINDEVLGEK